MPLEINYVEYDIFPGPVGDEMRYQHPLTVGIGREWQWELPSGGPQPTCGKAEDHKKDRKTDDHKKDR
jgi:hypothetical protein